MGRPLRVVTFAMVGAAYVSLPVTLEDCSGLCTVTVWVPTPRGATHVTDVVDARKDALTTTHGASPTSTANGHGCSGNPVPSTVTAVPPGVPTGCKDVTPVTTGASKHTTPSPCMACPATITLTATDASAPGGTVQVIVEGNHCTAWHSASARTSALDGAQVREAG
jgi:hypothetical protein